MEEKYGTSHPIQNDEIKKKIVNTRNERYFSGTEEANAAKAEMIEKTKQTLQERYGVDTPLKCPEFLENLKQLVANVMAWIFILKLMNSNNVLKKPILNDMAYHRMHKLMNILSI